MRESNNCELRIFSTIAFKRTKIKEPRKFKYGIHWSRATLRANFRLESVLLPNTAYHYESSKLLSPSKGLPTTEQTGLPARVLREANEAVKEALNATNVPKKRKYTTAFTAEDRAAIGRYASENGNAAAVKKFRATHNVGESTVRSFKKKYLEELKRQVTTGTEVTSLRAGKRGRKTMLGEQLDTKVQSYIKALRSAGTLIGTSVVMAAATGILTCYDRTLLVEHGGHISISKTWAMSLLKRIGFVKGCFFM